MRAVAPPMRDCRQPEVSRTRCLCSGVERAPSRMLNRGASKLPRTAAFPTELEVEESELSRLESRRDDEK